MNKNQKAVLVFGTICLIVCVLVVPYEGTCPAQQGRNLRQYIGYRAFFDPPTSSNATRLFPSTGYSGNTEYPAAKLISVQIISQRVWLEMVTIGFVTFAATLMFGGTKQRAEASPPKPDFKARLAVQRERLAKMLVDGYDEETINLQIENLELVELLAVR